MLFRDPFLGIRDAYKMEKDRVAQASKATEQELIKVKRNFDIAKQQLAYLEHQEGDFKAQIESLDKAKTQAAAQIATLQAVEKAKAHADQEIIRMRKEVERCNEAAQKEKRASEQALVAVEKARKENDKEMVKVRGEVDKSKAQIATLELSLADSKKTAERLAQDCIKLKDQITVTQ